MLRALRQLTTRPGERAVSHVPRPVLLLFAGCLVAQLAWHASRPAPLALARDLPPAPSVEALQVVALAEPSAFARLLMYWLQAFDHQPGLSLAFRDLDYTRVVDWLTRIGQLDPGFTYPLLSAARIYTEVQDNERRRLMLEYVSARFREDPDSHWQWQAHAVYVAQHRIRDPAIALRLARELRELATGPAVPGWARQLELFVLENMGELETAKILLGGLIESGAVSDPNEIRFLTERLESATGAQQPAQQP
jgi:hypothetical protein